jgi:hypothetical protein
VTKKRSSRSIELEKCQSNSQLNAGYFSFYFHENDKYLMHTYQASVRAQVKGRSQVIKTEVQAISAQ